MNNNIQKLFLLGLLLVLLMAVVSAEEISADDSTVIEGVTSDTVEDTSVQTSDNNIKTIDKQINGVKKAAGAYSTSVSNYTQLVAKVEEAKTKNCTNYTINLNKGNYNATTSMR